jgi:cysteine desulfurase
MPAVYFDHNATTPLHPRVREAMLPWLGERHGNPSSLHGYGKTAREAVEEARAKVAELVGGAAQQVIFTGSGTEANNAVVFHHARRTARRGRLVISAIEHPSVRQAANRLAEEEMEITWIPATDGGAVEADAFADALRSDTCLVALMLANNELGTLQPVATVAAACRRLRIPMLCDAVQAAGKIPVNAPALGVDYLVLGAHKINGPVGAAAVWVSKGAELSGHLVGGSQERNRRAGTENVAAIVGFGEAAMVAREELESRRTFLAALRDRFEAKLPAHVPGAVIHFQGSPRLPNTSNVAFSGVKAGALLARLDDAGFAVSTASACSAGSVEPSGTLLGAGISREEALSSLRMSFGATNQPEEVDAFLDTLAREVEALRHAGVPAGALNEA